MKPEQKKAINRTILKCREMLEKDIENRLVTYGILMDEPWIEKDKLSLSDEQEQVYKDLRDAIAKEMKGGLSEKEALISYIREVTYTYLNRIAALRVMEVRGLMEEVLVQKEEYSNRSYGHRNFFEIAREFCKLQSDEGLSYFISLIFKEVSADIGLVFNIDDEYSIIGPSNHALVEIIRLLTTDIDKESWQQDEIIGWIYQYFNEEEKDDVFDRLYNKKEKIKSIDIPAATQLFTPDWIVEWIVNNSLGKLREEINNGEREHKKLEKIKLLDPCCGSGHFLVKAYDLFYQYYIEDGYSREEIPFLILENNLHGIDIDTRAIQLTALILYIKVRVSLIDAGIQELNEKITVNLVCADAVLLNGDRLTTMKKQFENNDTVLKMIEIIYDEFKDTRLKGSLIQPEKRLIPLIEEYKVKKQKILKKGKKNEDLGLFEGFDEFEKEQEETVLNKSEKELFKYLEQVYSQATRANDINNLLFANEAKKSVLLLNTFLQKYDVVVTNPPYMGKSNMNEVLKDFVNDNYKLANQDLYSIFIMRVMDFLDNEGLMGMITQESFMFIKSYIELRDYILNNSAIYKFVHLGTRAFDDISGERVSTSMFVLKKGIESESDSLFIKLDHYPHSIEKRNNIENQTNLFPVKQSFFKKLEGSPFLYYLPDEIKDILSTTASFVESFGEAKTGINTGNNDYFVKFWWEINGESERNFVPYAKGGGSEKFYGTLKSVVDWRPEKMKEYKGCRLMNQSLFFKEGLTFSGVGSKGFGVRFLPDGFVFDSGGSFINIKKNVDKFYVLGILASDFADYLLDLYNPTINFKNNDIHRLPAIFDDTFQKKISSNVKRIIDLKKQILSYDEKEKNFNIDNFILNDGSFVDIIKKLLKIEKEYLILIEENNSHVYDLYKIGERTRKLINEEITKTRKIINKIPHEQDFERWFEKEGKNVNRLNLIQYLESKDFIPNKIFKDFFTSFSFIMVGIIFGRWHIQGFGNNQKEGILVLDTNFIEDILYEVIEVIFGEDNFEKVIDEEIPEIIGKDLLDWFKKDFFVEHIKKEQYQSRPIYWHVCSPNKTFNALLYYHELNDDTLYKLKSNHLKPKVDNIRNDLNFYREKMSSSDDKKQAKQYENRVIELEKQVGDLEVFDKQIEEIIASGYKPDIDQGVLYNITPLNPILAKKIEK
ncbi:BREX-1 system adenine-specific DNA-methyltransferase PglX [Bacillus sp. UNC69MF]|uniref:BREX-1 system adenine-specific DNA-methyltransferase PglX n=1 Tax=Bacillus sp. UNC69MF TaxID=1449047 RepID=UPI0005199E58|nr:BREX-1 system adenine-specific DNA-methyltransferase PglX [Bacillus sp. UNC69MF]